MPDGTGLNILQERIPENYYDVGIAEEHAVTFAAGLATQGVTPVVAIYSTFLQRAFDQIIHDVALQKLHAVFVLDRAGLVGADGPTHHGTFDLTYLRLIPGMVIMAPKDESELRDMLYTAVVHRKGPVAIRYPRGNALGVPLKDGFEKIEIGKGEVLLEGKGVTIIAVGSMVDYALKSVDLFKAEGYNPEIINMRYVKPLDTELLHRVASSGNKIITLEENTVVGGFGSGVLEFLAEHRYKNDVLTLGLPDEFIDHGTQPELHNLIKLDPKGIVEKVKAFAPLKSEASAV